GWARLRSPLYLGKPGSCLRTGIIHDLLDAGCAKVEFVHGHRHEGVDMVHNTSVAQLQTDVVLLKLTALVHRHVHAAQGVVEPVGGRWQGGGRSHGTRIKSAAALVHKIGQRLVRDHTTVYQGALPTFDQHGAPREHTGDR